MKDTQIFGRRVFSPLTQLVVGLVGTATGRLKVFGDKSINLRIQTFDSLNVHLDQLSARDGSIPDCLGHGQRRVIRLDAGSRRRLSGHSCIVCFGLCVLVNTLEMMKKKKSWCKLGFWVNTYKEHLLENVELKKIAYKYYEQCANAVANGQGTPRLVL